MERQFLASYSSKSINSCYKVNTPDKSAEKKEKKEKKKKKKEKKRSRKCVLKISSRW